MPRIEKSENMDKEFHTVDELDVCNFCSGLWVDETLIAHPPYEGKEYTCVWCGRVLTKEDN